MNLARALLVLGRVSNLPTVWSNCLCGWLIGAGTAATGVIDWTMLLVVCAGATGMYLGGMFLNDACDAAFDREHRPERPIPAGAISERAVWQIGIGLLAAGVGVLSLQGGTTALLALALFNCILVYNFIHKKIAWSPLLMALCRLFLILLVAAFAFKTVLPNESFFAHLHGGQATWTALVLCLYVIGLSALAKVESAPGTVRYWPGLLLAAPVVLAWFMNPADQRTKVFVAAAIFALWVMRSLRHTYWAEKPDVGRTVGGLLAGIVWVDLLAVAVAPQGVGLIFLGLFAAALAAQRWVPAT